MKRREILVAGAVAIAAGVLVGLPPLDRIGGLSIDVLFALRHAAFGNRYSPSESRSVVVAIDEETYRQPPFRDLPKVMWTRQIARVMNAVLEGGARVVGFDVIFPTSVERYVRGFDRDFLVALHDASQRGQVVLAEVQHQAKPVSPHPGYSFAVGHQKNIRPANVFEDDDGVIRRVPLMFRSADSKSGERKDLSMALELASRATSGKLELGADDRVTLDGYTVPGGDNGAFLVNFEGGSGAIPTYSLADLFACAEQGRVEFFRKHFAGKVAFVGAVLDVEDRKLTSKRFMTGREGVNLPERCALPVMRDLYRADVRRDTIPGVYIHATAVNNLLRHDALRELGTPWQELVGMVTAVAAAIAVMLLTSLLAGIILAAGTVIWTIAATVAMQGGLVLPLFPSIGAAVVTFVVLAGYRFAIADKDKRYLRRSFSLYLPRAVVGRLAESRTPPALGGETRELSAFFSDIEGFTAIAEGLSPRALVSFLNAYLSVITDTIESHGGFVDKFIGDAVVGVFGAPLSDPDHARHAVEAALACQRRLAEKQSEFGLPGDPVVGTRIGINSGEMLVGNIGSRRRFNYTIMGDAVNLASRLEGANKAYGTRILVSDRTAEMCGTAITFREVDIVRVLGREASVGLYEPYGLRDHAPPDLIDRLDRFAAALADYRGRRFAEAAEVFDAMSAEDPVAQVYLERTRHFTATPPPAEWDGVMNLDEK